MDSAVLARHFGRIGARVATGSSRQPIDVNVLKDRRGGYFAVRSASDQLELIVLDVQPEIRHLLLMARVDGRKEKFLCGHDERDWFVAAVPEKGGVSNVRQAIEALKPPLVQERQRAVRLKSRKRLSRRNEAYVRQGEWFFLPAPDLDATGLVLRRNEPLSRGRGSKPHWCEELVRDGGEQVYVNPRGQILSEDAFRKLVLKHPQAAKDMRPMRRNPKVFVRGRVSHPDHKTIVLHGWHRVAMNTENEAPSMRWVTFLD